MATCEFRLEVFYEGLSILCGFDHVASLSVSQDLLSGSEDNLGFTDAGVHLF